MLKRIVFYVFSIILVQSAMAQSNHYDFSAVNNGKTLYYIINGNNVTVTYPKANSTSSNFYVGHSKPTGDLVIPSSVTNGGTTYAVTAIDGKAFFYCSGLTSVVVPNTVTTIGDSAFTGCSNITAVELGNAVLSLGYASFRGCSKLPSIIMPASLSSIDNYAFFACPQLKKIGSYAMIPPTVTGNTLSADTLVVHCDAMTAYQNTFPWSTRFANVIGFAEDLPRVYDTVAAYCSYTWHGNRYYESNDSIACIGLQNWVCDSLYILTLTIDSNAFESYDTLTLCYSLVPYDYADTVFGDQTESGDYMFNMESIDGCDSTVNLNLTVHQSEETQLCMVSVADNRNELVWTKDAAVAQYNIYRESNTAGQYDLVAEVPYDTLSSWRDEDSRPVTRSYRYRITSVDSCGIESDMSDIHKTMHLTISQGIGNSWNLVWTEYEGTEYSTYQIYRGTDPYNVELIDEMPAGGNTTYTDPDVEQDTVYYQVAIVKDAPCFATKAATIVRSNIATNGNVGINMPAATLFDLPMYPNPAKEKVTMKCEVPIVKVEMTDVSGRLLESYCFDSNIVELSLDSILPGTYLLLVTTTKGTVLKRLIVK